MSTDIKEFENNLGNLLNEKWGGILGQKLIEIEQLKFQHNQQMDNLRAELHQAQIDLMKAQGKVITNPDVD